MTAYPSAFLSFTPRPRADKDRNMIRVITGGKTEITIVRANGQTEIKTLSGNDQFAGHLNDFWFGKMRDATSNAGRGQLISYRNIDAVIEDDYQGNCDRCTRRVDTRNAYKQTQQYRGHRVIAYYCNDCQRLLQTIGQGEYTAMQERTGYNGSIEPEGKTDY